MNARTLSPRALNEAVTDLVRLRAHHRTDFPGDSESVLLDPIANSVPTAAIARRVA